MKTFIFTCGDINGIGPEIVLKTLNRLKASDNQYIFIIPGNVFEKALELVNPQFEYDIVKDKKFFWRNQVQVVFLRNCKSETGVPTKISGKAAFDSIKFSFKLLKKKAADAVITAPISKYAIKLAGISYPGHTEMYADWCNEKNYLMMFLSDNFNAALNTIHIPVKNISKSINKITLRDKLNTAIKSLKKDLGIKYPKIAVLGLNPHSGENNLIGSEESKIISPVIKGFSECEGPFSPDAFFAAEGYKRYNLVFGMYHDQVLIPFKMLNFKGGVNFTAGLPFIRTSPDHGTAYDIAWLGKADEGSMYEAFKYAEIISKNRNQW